MRDNNINIGDPDYNHNIDILLRSIIDRANLRRSTTSSTTIDHQLLHLHQSGSASTSTTYLPQQQEEIDIGIIGTIYSLEPTQPLCTTFTSSTTAPVRQQQLQPEHRQQHHNISMINNIESPEDAHQEEFDNNNQYILQSMRIIYYNNNMEAWTGTIIDHNIFSTSLRQLQLHPQSDEPNLYINNIGSDINIILFIIHDNFICISKTDMQQEIINSIAPEGAQLINIELDNINFIDNISADIINLTYLDFIQQPHLQQRLPIQLRQALLHHHLSQHRLDHHRDHHSQQQPSQHLLDIREEDDNQQQEDQQEDEANISEDSFSDDDSEKLTNQQLH